MTDIDSRHASENAFEESENRFRDLVEGSVDGIMIHRDFKALFANDAFARLFGFDSPQDLLALDSVLELAPPDVQAQAKLHAANRLRGDEAPTEYEYEGLKRDGSRIWLVNLVRVISWRGEPAIQSTVVDITERKKMEEELRQARDSFERRVAERTRALTDEITERKRAEAALKENEERYRELFDESPIAIWEDDWSLIKQCSTV